MTFQEAATLKSNQPFIERLRVAVSKWQDYLINTGTGDPEYEVKVAEGARINANFENEVQKCLNAMIGDTEFLALQSGATVTDAQLSAITEKYIKAFSPPVLNPAAMMTPGYTSAPRPAFLQPAAEPRAN